MIDFELAFRNSEPKIPTPNFGGGVILKPTEEDEEETRDGEGVSYDDEEYMQRRWSQFVHNTNLLEAHTFQSLTRDSLILLPYRVYGYVLLSRKWYPLDIDLVKDVPLVKDGDDDGFEKLIIPDGHKNIVRALVKTHARGGNTAGTDNVSQPPLRQFDVVKGKGKGLIILLHGAPGVGKTSTAECVAANAGRPLFPITCGDLGGTSAQEVERNLERFFDLARKWGCVLLLDEADVFLTARNRGWISQNILVSVFLRVLEYYSGILILTTNRVGDFDEAVKSRVHCALYYPPLDRRNTKKIWKMNLELLQKQNESPDCNMPVRFDRKEILEFADSHWKDGNRWNGRQIKNAFQTAVALADWDSLKGSSGGDSRLFGPQLERRHFETVSRASTHFDTYLSEVRGDDETRARMNEVREDDYDLPRGHGRKSKPARGKNAYGGKARHFEYSESDTSESSSSEEAESSDGTDSESVKTAEPMRKKGAKRSDKRKGRKDY
ncbi:Spermatogenesis-associated protein 5-like protein 1 [Lasiodiplodia theobromae]|uniref:Spermatogenesis-associated protein 5-like protein 1 n=1 Tax=Lasiodiplodia theobromae TaxID=45133 RepID=A0A5N5D071_9PEZI|nr:Spermatogenesis-associated protein 5-like protein 1 [Lasiodiplodia theobromae]